MEALVSTSASALHAMGASPAAAAGAQAFYCFVATLFTVFALDMAVHVVVAQGGGTWRAAMYEAWWLLHSSRAFEQLELRSGCYGRSNGGRC